jgi:Uma2 family endonuclease
MATRTADYLDAVEHLPRGATLVIQQVSWDDYEQLVEDLAEGPHVRVSYDRGTLQIVSPLPEHEEYARFIDRVVAAISDLLDITLQNYGSATWKSQRLARGVEPESCYYVANAERVIGKRRFDLESDPPPDIVVEIDITNESLSKFSIYSALRVPEIWRYDSRTVHFYQLAGDDYREVAGSSFLPRLTPVMLADALEQMKTKGQTAALHAFRREWKSP